jgi:hypothetical protein
MANWASQASDTVGAINTGTAGQLTGVAWTKQVIVGDVMSCTAMVLLHVDTLPQSSSAIQVRVTL